MEMAAGYKPFFIRLIATYIKHGARGFYCEKAPLRKALRKENHFFTCSRTDAKNSRISRESGKHRLQKKMKRISNGCCF